MGIAVVVQLGVLGVAEVADRAGEGLGSANSKKADERIEAACATVFAVTVVVRMVLVPVVWNL